MFRAIILAIFLLVTFSVPAGFSGAEWYVAPPPTGSDSNPGTEEQPFATIQKGIDTAADGDTVNVAEGAYFENIEFTGKNIILRSTDPTNPTVVENTIIDGNTAGSVVVFDGTEDETCTIAGFTIRNGESSLGGGICGGTPVRRTHATIENNQITGNRAFDYGGAVACCDGTIRGNSVRTNNSRQGGGLAYCDGVIHDNAIDENDAWGSGGGLAHCHGEIHNNTITRNEAGDGDGGGLYECDGTIRNNVIRGNWAWFLEDMYSPAHAMPVMAFQTSRGPARLVAAKPVRPYGCGAGLSHCDGTISNNVISANWAIWSGGGLAFCNGTVRSNLIAGNRAYWDGPALRECNGFIQNNTITENKSLHSSGGLFECAGGISNCIILGNIGTDKWQLVNSSEPTYSCIQGWTGGDSNIGANPSFVAVGHWDDNQTPSNPWDDVWVEGDYCLRSDSPCIDAGDNSLVSPFELDLDCRPRLWRGKDSLTVDMGAYEHASFHFRITGVSETPAPALTWTSRPGDTYIVWSCTVLSPMTLWKEEARVPSGGEATTWSGSDARPDQEFYTIELE